ncbi:TPA: hypothetical protein ACU3MR_002570 [Staphylococcus aureus]
MSCYEFKNDYTDNECIQVRLVKHQNGCTGLYGTDKHSRFFSAFTLTDGKNLQNDQYVQLDLEDEQSCMEQVLIDLNVIEPTPIEDEYLFPVYKLTDSAYVQLDNSANFVLN